MFLGVFILAFFFQLFESRRFFHGVYFGVFLLGVFFNGFGVFFWRFFFGVFFLIFGVFLENA